MRASSKDLRLLADQQDRTDSFRSSASLIKTNEYYRGRMSLSFDAMDIDKNLVAAVEGLVRADLDSFVARAVELQEAAEDEARARVYAA